MLTPTQYQREAGPWATLVRAWRSAPAPPLTWRMGLGVTALFALAAFGFPALLDAASFALGQPFHIGGSVTSAPALLDAGWHAAVGVLMVLPTGDLRLFLFGPILTTEIDVDHLYGAYLPTEVGRPAHDLFFLLLLVVLLGWVAGRTGALLGAAGWLGHVSVDGGGFPFLAPFTRATWSLSLPVEVALATVAVLLLFGAVRPWAELTQRHRALAVVLVAVLLAVLLAAGGANLVRTAGV